MVQKIGKPTEITILFKDCVTEKIATMYGKKTV